MMKLYTAALLFFVLFLYGQKPIAKFSASLSGSSIAFADASSGSPQTYFWEFPNGFPSTSTSANPIVTYSGTTPYQVRLTVTNGSGSSTLTKTISGSAGNIVDLSTGRNDDGSLISSTASVIDNDWSVTNAANVTTIPFTRITYTGWSYAALGSNPQNSVWITHGPEIGYFDYKSKTFTIPEGITDAKLNLRSLSFVRNWTSLVKINSDNTTTATQITATSYLSDGAKGWINSRSPEVVNYPISPGTYYIKVQLYTNNGSVRGSIDVNANVQYGSGSKSSNNLSFSSPSSSFCKGASSVFNAVVEGESVPVSSYSWVFKKGNDSVLSTGLSPNIIFPKAGTYSARLKVIYADGSFSSLLIPDYLNVTDCEDYARAPNSYIFDVTSSSLKDKAGIWIPVKKAYKMWADANGYLNQDIPSGTPSAFVYWEDVSGLIKSGADYRLEISGSGEDAKIKVPINRGVGEGNAVISFHVGSNGDFSDPVYWSWHFWATDDPTNGTNFRQGFETRQKKDGSIETIQNSDWGWMDRNLGAVGNNFNNPQWNKNGGLLYQWGRKDPIPSLDYKGNDFYEVSGAIGKVRHGHAYYTNGSQSINDKRIFSSNVNVIDNIRTSVQNPVSLIYNTNNYNSNNNFPYNWFGAVFPNIDIKQTAKLNLWSDNSKGLINSSGNANFNSQRKSYQDKSSYDPCPNGWRIPSKLVPNYTNNGFANDTGIRIDYSPFGVYTQPDIIPITNFPIPGSIPMIKIMPTDINTPYYLKGIKNYSWLGYDFTNVNGKDMGVFPGTGLISKDAHGGEYSDGHEGYLWTATMLTWRDTTPDNQGGSVRFLPDTGQPDIQDPAFPNVKGRYQYNPNYNNHTSEAMGCRCIKDPLYVVDNYNFPTEYINEPVINYTEGLDNPNTYIVVKSAAPQILRIPVSKAFSVYNQLLSDQGMLIFDDLKVNVNWTTNQDLIQNISINQSPSSIATIKDSEILININPTQTGGNAVVTLHNGSINNPIYWSWHIWVTNNQPEALQAYLTQKPIAEATNYVNYATDGPPLQTEFMDRNLGAIEAFPTVSNVNNPTPEELSKIIQSGGMLYQFGRKDPLPSFKNPDDSVYIIYKGSTDSNGNVTYLPLNDAGYSNNYMVAYNTYSNTIVPTDKKNEKIAKVISYSVQNPLTYLSPSQYTSNQGNLTKGVDWISNEPNVYPERWGRGDKKSPFDPCPSGWRIPDMTSIGTNLAEQKGTSPWYKDGINQEAPLSITNDYSGKVIKNPSGKILGYQFQDNSYKIGNYPFSGFRGYTKFEENVNSPKAPINNNYTGIWTDALIGNYLGRTHSLLFNGSNYMATDPSADPYMGMSCRCVKIKYDNYNNETGPILKLSVNELQPTNTTLTSNDILDKIKTNDLKVFPNPVKNNLYIDAKENSGKYEYILYNMSGQIIKKGVFYNNMTDLSALPLGTYIININNSSTVFKIIKS